MSKHDPKKYGYDTSIRWKQKQDDKGQQSSARRGEPGKNGPFSTVTVGSISVPEVMMTLRPTMTRCGARPIAGDTRESSWAMVSQPTKTRQSRLIGLIDCYGKASDIGNAFTCTRDCEIVSGSLLLSPAALGGSLCLLRSGFGVGLVFHRKFAPVCVGCHMD